MPTHLRVFLRYVAAFVLLWICLAMLSAYYPPLDPQVLSSKASADRARSYIKSFGAMAPALFVSVQILQVVIAPIPGQAAAFVGGYIFGWKAGVVYTMTGLTLGSWLAISLTRRYGRALINRINGKEAVEDFEAILSRSSTTANIVTRSREALQQHSMFTFFMIMLLPGLPDDLVCFVVGLSDLPIRKLIPLVFLGRLPANIGLAMLGDGFSSSDTNALFWALMGASIALAAIYLYFKDKIEVFLKSCLARFK